MEAGSLRHRNLFAIALALSLTACDAPWSHAYDAKIAEDAANADLKTTRTGLIYHGKALELGAPMSKWIEVLGSSYRVAFPVENFPIYVWDGLGIRLYPDTSKELRVETATIVLKLMDSRAAGYDIPPPGSGIHPIHAFNGSVSLHGVIPITANSTIRELRAQGGDQWDFSCTKGVATCFTRGINQPKRQLIIAFAVDEQIERSPIYTVEVKKPSSWW